MANNIPGFTPDNQIPGFIPDSEQKLAQPQAGSSLKQTASDSIPGFTPDQQISHMPGFIPDFQAPSGQRDLADKFISKTIPDSRLQEIMRANPKSDLSLSQLKNAVAIHGGAVSNYSSTPDQSPSFLDFLREGGKELAGKISSAATGGLLQQLWRQSQSNPANRAVLDEINQEVEKARSPLESVGNLGLGISAFSSALGAAKTASAAIGVAPKVAKVTGLAASPVVSAWMAQANVPENNPAARASMEKLGFVLGSIPAAFAITGQVANFVGRTILGGKQAATKFGEEAAKLAESEKYKDMLNEGMAALGEANAEDNYAIKATLQDWNHRFIPNGRTGELKLSRVSDKGVAELISEKTEPEIREMMKQSLDLRANLETLANHPEVSRRTDLSPQLNFFANVANKQSAATYIDRLSGGRTQIAQTLREMGDTSRVISIGQAGWGKTIDEVLPEIESFEELTAAEMQKVQREITQPLAREWEAAGHQSLNIKENYIPTMRSQGKRYALNILNQMEKVGKTHNVDLTKLTDAELNTLEQSGEYEFTQLADEVEKVQGEFRNAREFTDRLLKMVSLDPQTIRGIQKAPSFTKQQLGGIPEFVQEMNPRILFKNWVSSMYQTEFESGFQKLRDAAKFADKAGQDRVAKWVMEVHDSLQGLDQKGWIQRMSALTELHLAKWAEKGGEERRLVNDMLPFLHTLGQNYYVSAVGSSIPASLSHMAAPFTSLMPELGVEYSNKIFPEVSGMVGGMMRGNPTEVPLRSSFLAEKYGKAIGDLHTLSGAELLANEGIVEQHWTGEMDKNFINGARAGLFNKVTTPVLEGMKNVGMGIFQTAMKATRTFIFNTAQVVGKDLIERDPAALQFVERMQDLATKRQLLTAIRNQDVGAAQRTLASYFNMQHGLDYSKFDAFQFGHQISPWLRMFTKLPTTVVGKAVFESAGEGGSGVVRKLVAPYVALEIANQMMSDEMKESPQFKTLLGSQGLSRLSPAGHIFGLFSPHHSVSPIVATGRQFYHAAEAAIKDAAEGDPLGDRTRAAADNALFSTLSSFVLPVTGTTMTKTIPGLMGTETEKSEPGEKTINFLKAPLLLLRLGDIGGNYQHVNKEK